MANKKTDVKVDNEVVGTLQEENVESQKVTKESEHDDAFVSLRHIDKIYDNNVQAVFDFNLDIKKHEFIVFVGPSGCGKSTTLRMIAGLEDITKGELYIDNELCNDKTPKDRDIAMVFQSYALYPHMSVYENMAFGLKLRRLPKYEIDRRVHEAARILQIEEYLDRKPKALSGGQRQRVALGRAIVRNAKVFLMDEPLSNLDAKLRVQMRSEIIKLHNSLNATTIYVTHDQTEAMTMASRIVVMKLGRVQQIGSPIEIYNNPANLFVAGFIGSPAMNFFHVDYSAEDNSITFASGEKVVLPKTLTKGKSIPSKVIFGIRPEDIKEVDGETKVTGPEFDIDVNVAELLGNEYYVHADFGGTELVSKIPANRVIKTGDKIKVFFDLKKIHFFDPETEKSI
ncbi:MAG: sn-glycerol-3-phosphate ABC transporter ATP-binding protein UgpC [Bacilli bacterium]|nr:sn-glycerol-3-phosphate ABC transporter ATP-binding protein UgpC [Bacilli bacterium]MDD7548939.1 sn-glycerol-3-phosphate ABC transporter ATP-binding protein UgpC [Bacilli bacterium]MDD7598454.1 sn-glycerol-3-phosphate ABC transporter ATP-binding protein UgpC [Bacilli bacterium]MDY4156220.1 sn-glycerol-3-phosphate ABC transporter ATP-binding protein UgpC [Bacilli bacterium]MDY4828590.1 sn-glycerol-3-phosphate ABC transporter ATP-binding protein UgpC [Bacilli bacterium]